MQLLGIPTPIQIDEEVYLAHGHGVIDEQQRFTAYLNFKGIKNENNDKIIKYRGRITIENRDQLLEHNFHGKSALGVNNQILLTNFPMVLKGVLHAKLYIQTPLEYVKKKKKN